MAQELYKEETIGNTIIKAYVWEVEQGWTSSGIISKDKGHEVVETPNVFPANDFYASKEEAGEAVLKALRNEVA